MEPFSAAASAVGVTALALEGATKLYQALNAYRDGPHDVEELLQILDGLQSLLRAISIVFEDSKLFLPDHVTTALKRSLKLCEKSLLKLADKLDKCNAKAQDRTLQRLASRLRPVLGQADFEKMRVTVIRHYSELSAYAGLIDDFATGAVRQTVQRVDGAVQVVDGRLQHLTSQQDFQTARIMDMHTSLTLLAPQISTVQATLASFPTWFGRQLQTLERFFDMNFDSLLQPLTPWVMNRYAPLHGPKFVKFILIMSGFKTRTDPAVLLERLVQSIGFVQSIRAKLRIISESSSPAGTVYTWPDGLDFYGHGRLWLHVSLQQDVPGTSLTSPMLAEPTEESTDT